MKIIETTPGKEWGKLFFHPHPPGDGWSTIWANKIVE